MFDRHAAPLLRLASLPGSNLQAWAELYAQGSLEHPHFPHRARRWSNKMYRSPGWSTTGQRWGCA
ncbi:hypothetical protein NWF32_16515 [Pseudomonas qingdaonensis]|nr:hypothetical protein [Pseudomonas qingdaonensis]